MNTKKDTYPRHFNKFGDDIIEELTLFPNGEYAILQWVNNESVRIIRFIDKDLDLPNILEKGAEVVTYPRQHIVNQVECTEELVESYDKPEFYIRRTYHKSTPKAVPICYPEEYKAVPICYPEEYNWLMEENVQYYTTVLKNRLAKELIFVKRYHKGVYSISPRIFYISIADIIENKYIIREHLPHDPIESAPIVAEYNNAKEMFRDGWALD